MKVAAIIIAAVVAYLGLALLVCKMISFGSRDE